MGREAEPNRPRDLGPGSCATVGAMCIHPGRTRNKPDLTLLQYVVELLFYAV